MMVWVLSAGEFSEGESVMAATDSLEAAKRLAAEANADGKWPLEWQRAYTCQPPGQSPSEVLHAQCGNVSYYAITPLEVQS